MINDRLAELLSRKLSGEATADELQQLHNWLQSNQQDQYFSEILATYWNNRADQAVAVDITADQHFAHILEMAEEENPVVEMRPRTRFGLIRKVAVAAACAGLLIAGGSIFFGRDAKPAKALAAQTKQNQVVAGRGIRSKMVLPDGTQVWLNSDSKLQYTGTFTDELREVTLEGEAYFDVVKDPERPFIVHTSTIDIRVLGTAFNVKSYPQEKTIETTLIHGMIEVTNKNKPEAPKIILRPKEKLVFNKEKDFDSSPNLKPSQAVSAIAITALPHNISDSSLVETSWVYNRLIFEGETFSELAVKMERWFNVKIDFKNEKIANSRVEGSFEDENIEQALRALQYIAPFKFKIKNNEVEITQ